MHLFSGAKKTEKRSFVELTSKDIDGNDRQFTEWQDKVVMVVNVAQMGGGDFRDALNFIVGLGH